MVAHGLITGMLFFLAGSVKERYHTLEIKRLGGLLAAGAAHGLDPRLLRHGVARPARPGRVLGRVPRHPLGLQPGGRPERALFRVYMVDRRHRHGLRRRLPAVALQRVAFGTPKDEFADDPHIHDVHRHRVDRLGADAGRSSSCSASARTSSSTSPTRPSPVAAGEHASARPRPPAADPCSPSSASPSAARPSTTTPSRPRSSSRARSWCCSCVDLFADDEHARHRAVARRHRPARRADPGAHPGRRRHRPVSTVRRAPTWSTTSRWCSRRCSSSPATSSVLLSTNYIAEGDYWEGEYYLLLLVVGARHDGHGVGPRPDLASSSPSRLLSIPAYMLAAWRKRDLKGNEAGIKYYLMGVFASAVMLYGMSLIYGVTGTTVLADIGAKLGGDPATTPIVTLGIVFVVVGFAFKVSAVPFHNWAPDTYEGAPTPVTAFLSVASKAAGFVALLELIFVAFCGRADVYQPLMWVLAAVDHDRRQPHRPAPDQHRAHARLLRHRPGRLHAGPARGGRHQRRRSASALAPIVTYLSSTRDEPRGVRRGHRRGPQDPVGRDRLVRRPLPVRAGPHRGDDDLPVLAGRHPAARRLVRQVRHLPVAARAGTARRATSWPSSVGRQLGDRALLLRPGRAGHVDGARCPTAT